MQFTAVADSIVSAAAHAELRAYALRYNFISCLILAAQNGFGQEVDHLAALCWETWGEEQWWDAVKDLPHGRVRREGPARQGDAEPFGIEGGPFSAGRTHLMYAAQAGDVARLAWLMARGARLELKDWEGRTALHWAAQEGRVATVRELLARGAFVNAEARDYNTPLFAASMEGHLGVVRELLAQGATVRAQNIHGATALLPACFSGHVEVVRALLARGAADEGALSIACQENQSEVVQVLLQWSLAKSLQMACQFGHVDLVRMLLARGASPSAPGPFGWTPLHYARMHPEVAAVLRAAGAVV